MSEQEAFPPRPGPEGGGASHPFLRGGNAGAFARLAGSLRGRPDTEHETSFNRLAFVAAAALYFAALPDASAAMWWICIAYAVLAVALLAHILVRPGINPVRRGLALVLDVTIISLELLVGGEDTAVLFPLYLWLTLGNGFRFGVPWLHAAMALSVLQFAAVIGLTPFWQDQPHLSAGLLIGLIVVPLYAGTLIRKLSAATQAAEEASRAKSLFLASVSHELRTPLTAIIGMGALLRGTRLDGEQRDMVETVERASHSLLSLIESILNLSRTEAGRMPARTAPFDPASLLVDVRRLLGTQAREKRLSLVSHVTTRLPASVLGSAQQLTDIVLNLAGNAIKFTQDGGVAIALDAEPIGEGRVRLRCEVSDTGIGIAPEAQTRIFDSFVQADEGIFQRFGGTGLGLAICRRLVSLAGGEIGVRSAPGAGSTFWFTVDLPCGEGERPPSPPRDILILAGQDERAERLGRMLLGMGHRVERAATPGKARAMLRAPEYPAVVVMLSDGPDGPALSVAAELRETAWPRALPLILCQNAGREAEPGLPATELRHRVSALLPEEAGEAEWEAALALLAVDAPPPATPPDAPETPPLRPLTVLVADDNGVNRRVFAAVLKRAGHEPHLVTNGEEALDALDSHRYDAVLMDVNMPVLGGLEAIKLHRFTSMGGRHVPIIALTADATPTTRRLCTEAGVDAYLTKPVEPETLLATIAAAIRKTSAEGDAPAAGGGEPAIQARIHGLHLGPALDALSIAQLEALGGPGFLAELARDFLEDAEERLISLDVAVSERDIQAYRDAVHALRSGAANLGARALFELCSLLQDLPAADLPQHGRLNVTRLSAEIDRTRKALADHLDDAAG